MAEYPQPGGDQRSQQKFVIFDRFERLNTAAARLGLPDNQLAWLENLQPLAENRLQVVPAPAAPAATISENIILEFAAVMNNEDWIILFTAAGAGFYYNLTTGVTGQFAPDGTFSLTPDCTTWQAERVLIYDTVASYCTFDGKIFVKSGGLSPNITVTNPGSGYTTAPPVAITGPAGHGGIAVSVVSPGSFTAPGAGRVALNIPAPPAGGVQATGYATVVGPSPFSVQSVTITTAGGGYTNPFPVITLAVPVTGTPPVFSGVIAANGATAASTINTSGQVVSVFLTNPGSGFTASDTVLVVIGSGAGGGATFAATMSGAGLAGIGITNNSITNGATTNTFALVIDAPPAGGTPAAGTYTEVFLGGPTGTGVITSVTLTNPGAGYTSVPRVLKNPSGGIGPASFQAGMQPQRVTAVTVVNGGSGYPPSATLPLMFSGGPGITPATGTVTTDASGVVISAALLTGGNYPFGSTPLAMVGGGGGGTGATASAHVWPFVVAFSTSATLAVFQGRVFLGSGRLLQFTGTGASFGNVGFDDFLLADNAGATSITDADLVHDITALRSLNNYLWVVGDQSIKQIGTLFPTGAPPFQLLTLSSDQGTKWTKSCISFNRIFLFANRNGIFGVFGSTVQKISDDLDGIFEGTLFAAGIQGAVVDLNSKHSAVFMVDYKDVPPLGTRSLLLIFDGKRWFLCNQGTGLTAIVTVPTLTPLINQLWGSVTGTDITQLLADPLTAQPFKIATALSHNTNPVQNKRVLRAGFTASSSGGGGPVTMAIDTENLNGTVNTMTVFGGTALTGGANDVNNTPIGGVGVYFGITVTGSMAGLTFHNLIGEYQEAALWKTILTMPAGAGYTTEDGTPLMTEDRAAFYVPEGMAPPPLGLTSETGVTLVSEDGKVLTPG